MNSIVGFLKNPIAPFISMAIIVVIVLIVKAIISKK